MRTTLNGDVNSGNAKAKNNSLWTLHFVCDDDAKKIFDYLFPYRTQYTYAFDTNSTVPKRNLNTICVVLLWFLM